MPACIKYIKSSPNQAMSISFNNIHLERRDEVVSLGEPEAGINKQRVHFVAVRVHNHKTTESRVYQTTKCSGAEDGDAGTLTRHVRCTPKMSSSRQSSWYSLRHQYSIVVMVVCAHRYFEPFGSFPHPRTREKACICPSRPFESSKLRAVSNLLANVTSTDSDSARHPISPDLIRFVSYFLRDSWKTGVI